MSQNHSHSKSRKKIDEFEKRFQTVVARMRATSVLTIVGWAVLGLTIAIALLAIVDYLFESHWNFRAGIVAVALLTAACVSVAMVLRALKNWNRSATAAQVEQRFEDLGQAVRTSVQFRDGDEARGISKSLLQKLDEDVGERTQDLRLTEAIAVGPLKISIALLCLVGLLFGAANFFSWDWRMATSRALLGNQPYTTIDVGDGDTRVEEKGTFKLNTVIAGRTARKTQLLTREIDGESSEWTARPLTESDAVDNKELRTVSYSVEIAKVKKPFEYQVVSGKYSTPIHRVDVRYPLAIMGFDVQITPPEYTGLGTKSVDKGSFETVQGSTAVLNVELDHSPAKAWLELRPIVTPLGEDPEIETVALDIDGVKLSADLELEKDRFYQVFAETEDGTRLRANRFRIRVHEDRAPRLSFQAPDQLIEVHGLAEVLMKLKVADDYGLRQAGIVFQLNNDEEHTLEHIDIEDIVTEDGTITPRTSKKIEALFPLEYFQMTLKDSVSYYAYAEDNRPGTANRNETDLHFIDVRPFRDEFRMPEDNGGLRGMGNNQQNQGRDLPLLNEMIGRERFVLNRTRQIKRQDDRGKSADTRAIDNLIATQNETSEFAGFLGDQAAQIEIERGIPEEGKISELMYAAQDAMLASMDSLSNSEWEVAKAHEQDALQRLLDARERLDRSQRARNGRGGFGGLRQRTRRMMQRMRQPRTDRERARQIVNKLRRAAAEQEFVMEKISDLVPPETPEMPESEDEESEETPEDESEEEMDEDEAADAEDEMEEEEPNLDELRRELQKEQDELSEEIQDIVQLIEGLNQISPLAQQRTQRAAGFSGGVLSALERGETSEALQAAANASSAFRVLADNIAGTTADEATKRIEIARDLGMMLTDELNNMEDDIAAATQSIEDSELEQDEAEELELETAREMSQSALEQVEIARTINDVLDSITNAERGGIIDPEDRMVKRIGAIVTDNKLEENVERMEQMPDQIEALDWSEAAVQAGDLGERYEIVSQRLDAMHREILSPRLEQLRMLEKRTVDAHQQLTGLMSEDQISRWHQRTDGLATDINSAEVATEQVEALRKTMEAAGWGSAEGDGWDWQASADGTGLAAPDGYDASVDDVIAEIQRHIRELTVANKDVANTGAIPPQYKPFVERYFGLLSGANPDASSADDADGEKME